MLRLLLGCLALLSAGIAAQGSAADYVKVDLVASTLEPRAGGSTLLGFRMVPKPGWHTYWSNPGESGLAPTVTWEAPEGVSFGALQHPAPSLLKVLGITSFVHAGEHTLIAPMRLPAALKEGTPVPIIAKLNWLSCSESLCVPQRATLRLDLTIGRASPSSSASLLNRAEKLLPKRLGSGDFHEDGGYLRLRLPATASLDVRAARFFPDQNDVIDVGRQRAERQDSVVEVSAPVGTKRVSQLSGVLTDGKAAYRLLLKRATIEAESSLAPAAEESNQLPAEPAVVRQGAVTSELPKVAVTAAMQATDAPSMSFIVALGAAILGGLLLNLMPCVFPVLSLKAVNLTRSATRRSEARREALAYLAGTVTTTLLLGVALVVAKAVGSEIGWSFQLQSPSVVLLLVLLLTAIALNMAGFFEVRGPSLSQPVRGHSIGASFSTGALTTVIATPCSAPFMASAVGAALLLPTPQALAVFLGLGLGLGLPMALVGVIPAVRRALPRPGPWMERFRQVLAVPMLLTAVWFLWVLGRQTGVDVMALALLLTLSLAGVLWLFGKRQREGRSRTWVPLLPVAVASLGLLLILPLQQTTAAPASGQFSEKFSVERLAELRSAGRPVFVDFTADWCLACKVNEQIAINRAATQEAFRRAGVVTLVGDWTSGDPAITRFLAANGRNSIPFYLFYPPRKEPEVLPQVLTSGMLQRLARSVGPLASE